jgi:methyl-accepting chemotaxis protein
MKIETRLSFLAGVTILAVLLFSYILIKEQSANRAILQNFEKATELLLKVSDLLMNMTEEKHKVWGAITLGGSEPPEVQRQTYRDYCTNTDAAVKAMEQTLATVKMERYSENFRRTVKNALSFQDRLAQFRQQALAQTATMDDSKEFYDEILSNLNNFFASLAAEVNDADLVRKIVAQDSYIRFKLDLWYLRGSIGSALDKLRLTDFTRGKILLSRTNVEGNVNRIQMLSSPEVLKLFNEFTNSDCFKLTMQLSTDMLKKENVSDEAINRFSAEYKVQFAQVRKDLESRYQKVADFMASDIYDFTQARVKSLNWELRFTYIKSIIILIITIVMVYFISRSITRAILHSSYALSESSQRGVMSAETVSRASQTLADEASKQAAALEEISASLEEMGSMVEHNLESIEETQLLANKARSVADQGTKSVKEMTHAMEDLKKSSHEVSKIIKTIEEIAFQTNILALNAAVEAARAGEAGAGFAVVAEEVRNLAQRSAKAAQETATRIKSAVDSSEKGFSTSVQSATHLQSIVELIYQFNDKLKEITSASQQHNQGTKQINAAVSQLDQVTQSTAASAEEVASVSVELQELARITQQEVSKLMSLTIKGSHELKNFTALESGF